MFKFEDDYLNLIHLQKAVINEKKQKITCYFDGGKIGTEVYADASEFADASGIISSAFVFIKGIYHNPDRIGIVQKIGNAGKVFFLGGKVEEVKNVSDVLSIVESSFVEIKNKFYNGKQLQIVKTKDLTIGYMFNCREKFSVTYRDQAEFDAAIEKVESIGEGGGSTTKKVSTPTFSPKAGNISKGATVSISCSTSGATIYYTTDGSTPSTSSDVYSSPITVNADVTIKAFAVKAEMTDSSIATASYVVVLPKVASPVFTPAAGEVFAGTEVTVTCETDGAVIHYTTDGTIPTSDSPVYSSAIVVDEAVTIKAVAVKEDYEDSSIVSAAYTIGIPTVATPTFTPNGGNISAGDTVTMACATDGATIHYTLDGSNPTSSSAAYTEPVALNATTTVKAIAVKEGYNDSSVKSAKFTVVLPTCATPTFSPAAGEVTSGTTVTLNCATTGAVIHYTTNGSNPTASSPVYSDPIAITAATTIKAIGVADGYENSSVGSASYTIKPATSNYYFGVFNGVDETTEVPDPVTKEWLENLAGLHSAVATAKGIVVNDVTGDDDEGYSRYVYAYPKSLGELSTYQTVGSEPAPIESSFTKVEATIDDVVYWVYYLTNSTDTNNVGITFA